MGGDADDAGVQDRGTFLREGWRRDTILWKDAGECKMANFR